MSDQATDLYSQGQRFHAARRYAEALACFDRAMAALPETSPLLTDLLHDRGALLGDLGRQAEAVESYDRALARDPANPNTHYNRGNALAALGRPAEAVESYDRALAGDPRMIEAWHNRGTALQTLARYADAVESFDAMLRIRPGVALAWSNRGIALSQLGRRQEALENYQWAITLDPGCAVAWENRGLLLGEMGRTAEALAAHDRALRIDPTMAAAWYNRGNILREQHRALEALESYDRALAFKPGDALSWVNRSAVLRALKRIPEALESYDRALAITPDHAPTLASRGIVAWAENHDYASAARDLERAVMIDPACPYASGNLLLVRQYGGDWTHFDSDLARIEAGVAAGKPVVEPFVFQAVSSSPAALQACSAIYAADRYPVRSPLPLQKRRPGKIRIGYVSGEFREQATAYLMAGVYECHDKSRFVITAYDNGGSDGSPMRARLERAFDCFVDITGLSDLDAARKIQDDGIDILVNLNGYFGEERMGVFAHRPAAIQVNYLGFPATLGAAYIDYLIADRIVIPEAERQFYAEKIVYLPESYQANDVRRAMPEDIPDRAACGLPAEALVFCNFNAAYKLTPSVFASWMRILAQAPGSVLWLLDGVPEFSSNLRRAAEDAGIDGARLIFAPPLPLADHLARLAQADLFLDGLPYNAHTTASDALWAGVPLLTQRGTAFAGRVAASLLHAIGLPELVTENRSDYESLAVALAKDTPWLQALREKLADHRMTTPLFDTARFTKALEAGYETMLAKSRPESFMVPPA